MNKVIEQIHAHRSIRKFQKKDIENSVLSEILEAATMASSSGNMQSYSIIVTKDQGMKSQMFESHFKQSMLMDAPIFLTFCADFNRMRRWLQISNAANNFDNYMSFMISSIDAILASQNAALAAESLGLGLCYMGTTLASAKDIGEVLELPQNVVPIVGFALGYPDEAPELRKRLPLKGIIHHEKYQRYCDDDIREIYREKEEQGLDRYKSLNLNEIHNLAQIYTQVKYTEESHIMYSESLLQYLKDQNFLTGNSLV